MMNITLNFPGENSMTLKEWRGIYRVLCCWRGGRFFPVLWASHFSKRLLRAWPVRVRKSVQFLWFHRQWQILIPWSNWGFTAPSLRVLQEVDTAPFEMFHIPSIPPVCTSKLPHFLCTLTIDGVILLFFELWLSVVCSDVYTLCMLY